MLVSLGESRPLFVPTLALLDFAALDFAELSSASVTFSGRLGGFPLLDALFNPFLLNVFQIGHVDGWWSQDPHT